MSGFTKGPWQIVVVPHATGFQRHVADAKRRGIARVEAFSDKKVADANAALIASAPALYGQHDANLTDLDLLRQAIEAGDPKAELLIRVDDIVSRTRAALALARGEQS